MSDGGEVLVAINLESSRLIAMRSQQWANPCVRQAMNATRGAIRLTLKPWSRLPHAEPERDAARIV
jgi:hypothetical protein